MRRHDFKFITDYLAFLTYDLDLDLWFMVGNNPRASADFDGLEAYVDNYRRRMGNL